MSQQHVQTLDKKCRGGELCNNFRYDGKLHLAVVGVVDEAAEKGGGGVER